MLFCKVPRLLTNNERDFLFYKALSVTRVVRADSDNKSLVSDEAVPALCDLK